MKTMAGNYAHVVQILGAYHAALLSKAPGDAAMLAATHIRAGVEFFAATAGNRKAWETLQEVCDELLARDMPPEIRDGR